PLDREAVVLVARGFAVAADAVLRQLDDQRWLRRNRFAADCERGREGQVVSVQADFHVTDSAANEPDRQVSAFAPPLPSLIVPARPAIRPKPKTKDGGYLPCT